MHRKRLLQIFSLAAFLPAIALLGSLGFRQPAPEAHAEEVSRGKGTLAASLAPVHGTNGFRSCQDCHVSAEPTRGSAALLPCVRRVEQAAAERFARMNGPSGVITLCAIAGTRDTQDVDGQFGPVPFDHARHADWAEIGAGCATCHHYTPEGAEHPSCRTCHETGVTHEDMRKPGLKGAYHRQCLGCHREWNHEASCGNCHTKVDRAESASATVRVASKDDLVGVPHPPIPEPTEDIFETDYPTDGGSRVYFNHKRHTERYEIKCAECHRGDSCVRCHEYGVTAVARATSHTEHHQPCSGCHNTDDGCADCHRNADQGPPGPFQHAQTGWALASYHSELRCRQCHGAAPYARLDRECSGCHTGWSPAIFDHAGITSLRLDETHAEIECEVCHPNERYAMNPDCTGCHDDKGFPEALPGRRVELSVRQ